MPVLNEHRRYIADARRLDAFSRALQQAIRPEHVVLDLGAGTGILSFLACQAGARRVYAVDDGSIVGVARELARRNGFEGRVEFVREHSERLTLPERVDVVVTDQIGRLGVDAGLRQYMRDARIRLAKPDANLIPRTIEIWLAACEQRELRQAIAFWESEPAGFTWEPARDIVRATTHASSIDQVVVVTEPAHFATVDLRQDDGRAICGTVQMEITRAATLDAIAGWFRAELGESTWISNGPGDERIDRCVTLIPVSPPVEVARGDRVTIDLRVDTDTTGIAWKLQVTSPDGRLLHTLSRSTFEAVLLSSEDLARPEAFAGPRLTRMGTLEKQVLQLCDGLRSQRQIELLMYEYNRDVFASPDEAAQLVAAVLRRHAE